MELFHNVGETCSRITTEKYSTSFSSAINLLHKDIRQSVYNLYGFVRFADEIVDTFHEYDKAQLLEEFKQQTYQSIERHISLTPILHSFQRTVHEYNIPLHLIDAFFKSMELDLYKKNYDEKNYHAYIYGSAEAVGLMCLYIFCEGDNKKNKSLAPFASSLGAAFQKVNFLRDMKSDFENLERTYFPSCDFKNFSLPDKQQIEKDIQKDFDNAYKGILQLPLKSRFGVYVSYRYYLSLFRKIKKTHPEKIINKRIRIPDYGKIFLLAEAGIRRKFNLL
jgi:phytoene/squalene synthetase